MKHIIHLEADSYPDLRDQIRQLVVDHGLVVVTEGGLTGNAGSVDKPAPEKKASGKSAPVVEEKKAEPAAEPAAEAEVVVETKPEKKADKPAGKTKVDLDKCRAQVMAYVKEHGQVKGKELIESFGATKISDVAEDKLEDLFVAAGGAL